MADKEEDDLPITSGIGTSGTNTKRDKGISCCMLTQSVEGSDDGNGNFIPLVHWKWEDYEKQNAMNDPEGICHGIGEVLKTRFDNAFGKGIVTDMYGILHDKDLQMVWDIDLQKAVEKYKKHHVHFVVMFKSSAKQTIHNVALASGLEPQFIEKPISGRYAKDNFLSYLTHIKYDEADKHNYSANEVVTICGRDYLEIFAERQDAWLRAAAKIKRRASLIDGDWLEMQILNGKLDRETVLLTDEYFVIYATNSVRFDNAFRVYGERKCYRLVEDLKNGKYRLKVFFITGQPGAGKSNFTDKVVADIKNKAYEVLNEKWSSCSVASSNPLDDWCGEEIMVLDDLRGASLSASDWLKLLDPERVNRAGTRYKNHFVAPQVIIINSEKSPLEYFYYTKNIGGGNRSEAMDQFIRRLMYIVEILRYSENKRLADVHTVGRLEKADTQIMKDDGKYVTLNFGSKETVTMELPEAREFLADVVIPDTDDIRADSVEEAEKKSEELFEKRAIKYYEALIKEHEEQVEKYLKLLKEEKEKEEKERGIIK